VDTSPAVSATAGIIPACGSARPVGRPDLAWFDRDRPDRCDLSAEERSRPQEEHRMGHESTAPSGKPMLDDDDLQDLILERLHRDPVFHLGSGHRARVEVEVDAGEVTLRGIVRTPLDRRKADIIARALGATTVDNRLGVEEEHARRTCTAH
jgi:hypothetical protein